MAGKSYTMREMKDIVKYLVENQCYAEVRGRKMWQDFAATDKTTRSWQSLKETFLKRIHPDVHNPYYELTPDQIKSFRQERDVCQQPEYSKLDVSYSRTGNENRRATRNGPSPHKIPTQDEGNSDDTEMIRNASSGSEHNKRSSKSKKKEFKSLKELITYTEPLTEMTFSDNNSPRVSEWASSSSREFQPTKSEQAESSDETPDLTDEEIFEDLLNESKRLTRNSQRCSEQLIQSKRELRNQNSKADNSNTMQSIGDTHIPNNQEALEKKSTHGSYSTIQPSEDTFIPNNQEVLKNVTNTQGKKRRRINSPNAATSSEEEMLINSHRRQSEHVNAEIHATQNGAINPGQCRVVIERVEDTTSNPCLQTREAIASDIKLEEEPPIELSSSSEAEAPERPTNNKSKEKMLANLFGFRGGGVSSKRPRIRQEKRLIKRANHRRTSRDHPYESVVMPMGDTGDLVAIYNGKVYPLVTERNNKVYQLKSKHGQKRRQSSVESNSISDDEEYFNSKSKRRKCRQSASRLSHHSRVRYVAADSDTDVSMNSWEERLAEAINIVKARRDKTPRKEEATSKQAVWHEKYLQEKKKNKTILDVVSKLLQDPASREIESPVTEIAPKSSIKQPACEEPNKNDPTVRITIADGSKVINLEEKSVKIADVLSQLVHAFRKDNDYESEKTKNTPSKTITAISSDNITHSKEDDLLVEHIIDFENAVESRMSQNKTLKSNQVMIKAENISISERNKEKQSTTAKIFNEKTRLTRSNTSLTQKEQPKHKNEVDSIVEIVDRIEEEPDKLKNIVDLQSLASSNMSEDIHQKVSELEEEIFQKIGELDKIKSDNKTKTGEKPKKKLASSVKEPVLSIDEEATEATNERKITALSEEKHSKPTTRSNKLSDSEEIKSLRSRRKVLNEPQPTSSDALHLETTVTRNRDVPSIELIPSPKAENIDQVTDTANATIAEPKSLRNKSKLSPRNMENSNKLETIANTSAEESKSDNESKRSQNKSTVEVAVKEPVKPDIIVKAPTQEDNKSTSLPRRTRARVVQADTKSEKSKVEPIKVAQSIEELKQALEPAEQKVGDNLEESISLSDTDEEIILSKDKSIEIDNETHSKGETKKSASETTKKTKEHIIDFENAVESRKSQDKTLKSDEGMTKAENVSISEQNKEKQSSTAKIINEKTRLTRSNTTLIQKEQPKDKNEVDAIVEIVDRIEVEPDKLKNIVDLQSLPSLNMSEDISQIVSELEEKIFQKIGELDKIKSDNKTKTGARPKKNTASSVKEPVLSIDEEATKATSERKITAPSEEKRSKPTTRSNKLSDSEEIKSLRSRRTVLNEPQPTSTNALYVETKMTRNRDKPSIELIPSPKTENIDQVTDTANATIAEPKSLRNKSKLSPRNMENSNKLETIADTTAGESKSDNESNRSQNKSTVEVAVKEPVKPDIIVLAPTQEENKSTSLPRRTRARVVKADTKSEKSKVESVEVAQSIEELKHELEPAQQTVGNNPEESISLSDTDEEISLSIEIENETHSKGETKKSASETTKKTKDGSNKNTKKGLKRHPKSKKGKPIKTKMAYIDPKRSPKKSLTKSHAEEPGSNDSFDGLRFLLPQMAERFLMRSSSQSSIDQSMQDDASTMALRYSDNEADLSDSKTAPTMTLSEAPTRKRFRTVSLPSNRNMSRSKTYRRASCSWLKRNGRTAKYSESSTSSETATETYRDLFPSISGNTSEASITVSKVRAKQLIAGMSPPIQSIRSSVSDESLAPQKDSDSEYFPNLDSSDLPSSVIHCRGSSPIPLCTSPEISMVENITVASSFLQKRCQLLNKVENNKAEISCMNFDVKDVSIASITCLDSSRALMDQDLDLETRDSFEITKNCELSKNYSKPISHFRKLPTISTSLLERIVNVDLQEHPTITDSFQNYFGKLQVTSPDLKGAQRGNVLLSADKRSKMKKCSTPLKKYKNSRVRKSCGALNDEVLMEYEEYCRNGRKSCPPLLQHKQPFIGPENHRRQPNKTPKIKIKPKQKKIIKVKITKPKKRCSLNISETKLSIMKPKLSNSDSGIYQTVSKYDLNAIGDSEIHNHSDTCMDANECCDSDVARSNLNFGKNRRSNGVDSVYLDADNLSPEVCSMGGLEIDTSFVPSSQNTQDLVVSDALFTDDESSSELPPTRTPPLSEVELRRRYGDHIANIFPIACTAPDLSTINEDSQESTSRLIKIIID